MSCALINSKIPIGRIPMFKSIVGRAFARMYPPVSREQIKAEVAARHDGIGHIIAARFSRGNVNIKEPVAESAVTRYSTARTL
jgi:hypothetical protein